MAETAGVHAGLEAGGTKMVIGVAAPDGTLLGRDSLPTTTPDETLQRVRESLRRLAGGRAVRSLGIATFGPAQTNRARPHFGFITNTPKPGWSRTDLLGAFSDLAPALGFDTDVNGAALAEAGAWGGADPLAYVTVGTGLGVGVARGGTVLSGTSHYEMGHVPLPRAPGDEGVSVCPFHEDCAEGLTAGPSWQARLGHSLSEAAPDAPARAQAATYLGQLCRVITLCHAPGRIVLGGGVMKTPGLLEAVREEAGRRLNGYGPPMPEVTAPALGEDAGLRGAIELGRISQRPPAPARGGPPTDHRFS